MKIFLFVVLVITTPAVAKARTLGCVVETMASGEARLCGRFTWKLPQDHSYGNGSGVCAGLQMYTTMTKDGVKPGHEHAFWFTALADKDNLDQNGGNIGGYANLKFQGAYPEYFHLDVWSPRGLRHRISCEVTD